MQIFSKDFLVYFSTWGKLFLRFNVYLRRMASLHLVAFNVPYPPNQGGLIDVYAKIIALKKQGVSVILHAFLYDRPEAVEMETFCEKVYYYPREKTWLDVLSFLPFIVFSRREQSLYKRLMSDSHPILLEGLHSCFWLHESGFGEKIVWVRTHNIEHEYYRGLAKVERSVFKKVFFALEAFKLKRFERVLARATGVFCIAGSEQNHYKEFNSNVELLSAFHLNDEVKSEEGKGDYALYHGSLDVAENENAAIWLIENLGPTNIPFIIAGNNASHVLHDLVKKYANIQLKTPISTQEMDLLIKNAQVHVLPTFQNTGIKLKLLHALFSGRHCVVNTEMVNGSGLENYCHIAANAAEFVQLVQKCMNKEFDLQEVSTRKGLESSVFSNEENVKKLISKLQLH